MREEHVDNYRGSFIPADIYRMMASGELNSRDVMMLATIDNLVSPDKGCYATNDYLGQRLGITAKYASDLVAKLRRLGLVRQVGFDGKRRYLETVYSRLESPANYGRRVRKFTAHKENTKKKGVFVDFFLDAATAADQGKPTSRANQNMLIPDAKRTGKTTPTDTDFELATRLRQTLVSTKRQGGPYSRRAWANEFRLLRQQLGDQDAAEIANVLGWFSRHAKDQYTPRVYDAKQFRAKYAALRDAMTRQAGGGPSPKTPDLIISDMALDVEEALALRWPANTDPDNATAAIQTSLDNHADMVKAARKALRTYAAGRAKTHARTKTRTYDDRPELIEQFIAFLGDRRTFVENWMREVHRMACNWAAWRGDCMPWVLRRGQRHFERQGRLWFAQYSGQPADFTLVQGWVFDNAD